MCCFPFTRLCCLSAFPSGCRHIQCDIQLAAEKIQAPEQLKSAVVKLLHTHASAEGGRKAAEAATAAAQEANDGASDSSKALQRQAPS